MSHNHVVGDSPFLKRVLIPFWVLRVLIMVVDIGIYGLTIGVVSANKDNLQSLYEDYGIEANVDSVIAILCVVEAIIVLCLVLDLVSIIKRAQRKLTPRFFLIVNVIQTTFWLIMFILAMLGAKTGLSVGLNVICLLSFVGLLIYAAVVFHQHRTGALRGNYSSTNVESHGLVTATGYPTTYPPQRPEKYDDPQAYSAPHAQQPYNAPEAYNAPQAYNAQQPYDPQAYNVPSVPAQTESHFQQRYS